MFVLSLSPFLFSQEAFLRRFRPSLFVVSCSRGMRFLRRYMYIYTYTYTYTHTYTHTMYTYISFRPCAGGDGRDRASRWRVCRSANSIMILILVIYNKHVIVILLLVVFAQRRPAGPQSLQNTGAWDRRLSEQFARVRAKVCVAVRA